MSEFLEEEIRSFLWDDRLGRYVNKHGVEVTINEDSSVNAAFTVWKEKNESIEYGFNCQTLYRFIKTLGLNEVGDIDTIKAETLEKLYDEGEANLFCYLGREWLQFNKSDEGMIITDGTEMVHLLERKLDGVHSYMEYTRTFYNR